MPSCRPIEIAAEIYKMLSHAEFEPCSRTCDPSAGNSAGWAIAGACLQFDCQDWLRVAVAL